MEKDILYECYEKACEVIKKCSTPYGLFASGGIEGYNAVWARDSMISLIGSSFSEDEKFKNEVKEVFKRSLVCLSEHQSKKGQIPNAIDKWSKRKAHVDFQSIDSSLWYILGHFFYKANFKDNSLFVKYKNSIKKALTWVSYQDFGEDDMPEQLPTTDWQDAFPHKYGHTINTQALYYKVLISLGFQKNAQKLKEKINEDKETGLWNKNFYYAWRWKNHNKYKEIGSWFDSLGNLLAIVFELADKEEAEKIIQHINQEKINLPFPVKSIYPPIKKGDSEWREYFEDCDSRKPFHYSNAGIWPFIGSFYVLSLIKLGKIKDSETELKKLAEANLKGNFPEWINPLTKESHGNFQAWDAGTYIWAYEILKKKAV
jgi:glycogen debranching enzyme